MYNHFHKWFLENKSIEPKQFGLRVGHSNDLAIIQLNDQIFEACKNNLYTPDVFIDLSKSLLNCVSHDIALKAWIMWYKSKEPQLDKKLSVKHEAIY